LRSILDNDFFWIRHHIYLEMTGHLPVATNSFKSDSDHIMSAGKKSCEMSFDSLQDNQGKQNTSSFRAIFPFLHFNPKQARNENDQNGVGGDERDTILFNNFRQRCKHTIDPLGRRDISTSTSFNVAEPQTARFPPVESIKSNDFTNHKYKQPQIIKGKDSFADQKPLNSNQSLRSILRKNSFSTGSMSSSSIPSLVSESDKVENFSKKKSIGIDAYNGVTNKFELIKRRNSDIMGRKSSSTPFLLNNVDKTRPRSLSTGGIRRSITFDPQVSVREYRKNPEDLKSSTWWSSTELNGFKDAAIAQFLQEQKVVDRSEPSNRDRNLGEIPTPRVMFYNCPIMGIYGQMGDPKQNIQQSYLRQSQLEFQSILIIDPHDIFLRLFTKSFKIIFPHVDITTARNNMEALDQINLKKSQYPVAKGGAVHGFDIILAEERLEGLKYGRSTVSDNGIDQFHGNKFFFNEKPILSGSNLFERLSLEEEEKRKAWLPTSNSKFRFSLFIGTSAHVREDEWKLQKSGVSFVWGKPPPRMDFSLLVTMVKAIMEKRNNILPT